MHTAPASLRLSELTKLFGNDRAVDRVSLSIEPGSVVALLGPSGCGKTTTLRMIAGLLSPNAGEIYLDEKPISRIPVHRRNIGMLFQSYALFPHMTVAENLAFGLETRGIKGDAIKTRVAEALQLVQLSGYEKRMPSQLSGGQQQRVALSRALVVEPALLLLDEPLGALDKSLRESMQVELRALQQRLGVTTVMVTHDQDEALTMADQIVIMRDGRVEQIGGPVEIYRRPISRFIASFLGVSNFFRGPITRLSGDVSRVDVPGGPSITVSSSRSPSGIVTVSLRPESITVLPLSAAAEPAPNSAEAIVEQVVYHGFVNHFYMRLPNGEPLIAFQQNRDAGLNEAITAGVRVRACWDEESNHLVRDEEAATPDAVAA